VFGRGDSIDWKPREGREEMSSCPATQDVMSEDIVSTYKVGGDGAGTIAAAATSCCNNFRRHIIYTLHTRACWIHSLQEQGYPLNHSGLFMALHCRFIEYVVFYTRL